MQLNTNNLKDLNSRDLSIDNASEKGGEFKKHIKNGSANPEEMRYAYTPNNIAIRYPSVSEYNIQTNVVCVTHFSRLDTIK